MVNNNPCYMWYIFAQLAFRPILLMSAFFLHTEGFNFYGAKNVNHFFL